MRRAIEIDGLWEQLSGATRPPLTIEEAALAHLDLYRDVLQRGRASRAA
jgi:RNAse (barnase) inhibitor barstar